MKHVTTPTLLSTARFVLIALLIMVIFGSDAFSAPSNIEANADLVSSEHLVFLPSVTRFDWNLVWSDEFDYIGAPDPSHWDYEIGYIRNDELQYYTNRPANVRVEGGNLVIQSLKESYNGFNYTSASVISKGKASWTHGRIEVRARLPQGRGMWPAIWLLGNGIDTVGWPECGEIDIMEYVGYDPNTIYANIHTEAYNHVLGTGKGDSIYIPDPWQDFHVYAIEWDEEKIDFFVDDVKYFTFVNEYTGTATWPFDQPHYMILNAAVGGSWGGLQGVDDSIFPATYLIDYVRVYEARE